MRVVVFLAASVFALIFSPPIAASGRIGSPSTIECGKVPGPDPLAFGQRLGPESQFLGQRTSQGDLCLSPMTGLATPEKRDHAICGNIEGGGGVICYCDSDDSACINDFLAPVCVDWGGTLVIGENVVICCWGERCNNL